MAKVLICYFSKTGNTEKMARVISEVMRKKDHLVACKKVEDTKVDELLGHDCLIFGSPTYYGSMAWPLKKILDESVKFHGRLKGKVGGAFSSAANIGGGNETTILSILQALLIHGMVIQGDHKGDHYGPVSIDFPDERAIFNCEQYGNNLAELATKIFG